jgi:hypothetical protein
MRYLAALAILVSAGGLARAQDASERLEIKQIIDSWYRIEQGTSSDTRAHRGWARETIKPVDGQPWKYEYSYEMVGTYAALNDEGAETLRDVRERVIAKLDGAFDVLSIDADLQVNSQKARLEVRSTTGGRVAEITSLDGRGRKVTEAGDGVVMYTLPLALLRERQKGELRKPAAKEVVLVDATYDYEDMKLRRDVKTEGRLNLGGGKRVAVVPVEFRPGRSEDAAKPVMTLLLDRYGRIAEVVGDMEAFVRTMAADEKEAKPSDVGIQPKDRRDPMSKPLTPKKDPQDEKDAPPPPATPALIDKLLKEIERRMERVIDAAKRDVAAADDLYEDFHTAAMVARKRCDADPVSQGVIDTYIEDAHAAVGGWEHEVRVGERYVARVKKAAEVFEEAEAEAAFAMLKPLPARVLGGRDPAPKLEKMVAEARRHIETIAARRELQKMDLVLTGTSTKQSAVKEIVELTVCVFQAEMKVKTTVQIWIRDEWAIVNDDVYRVGETIGATGAKVERITQWGVTVSYKGATRELGLPK